jgi:hypothetical protein
MKEEEVLVGSTNKIPNALHVKRHETDNLID